MPLLPVYDLPCFTLWVLARDHDETLSTIHSSHIQQLWENSVSNYFFWDRVSSCMGRSEWILFCFLCFLVWILAWILVNFVHYGNALLCSGLMAWLWTNVPGTPVRIHLFVTSEILNLLAIFPSSNEIVSGWFVNVKLKTFIRARVPRILAPGSGGSN